MRAIVFIFLSSISLISYAGCTDIASIMTETLYIDISDGGCSTDKVMLSYGTKERLDKWYENIKKVPFASECTETKDGFKCRYKGKTPLAGATYKRIFFGRSGNACDEKGALGLKYICVKGCETAPEYLHGSDGSC